MGVSITGDADEKTWTLAAKYTLDNEKNWRPYFFAGMARSKATLNLTAKIAGLSASASASGNDSAFYGGGGIEMDMGNNSFVAFQADHRGGKVEDFKIGGNSFSVKFGYKFK